MIILKEINYKLYKSNTIIDNKIELIKNIYKIKDKICNSLNSNETTWTYDKYNFFQVSSPEINCYHLYKELKKIIRDFVNHNRPLWFQSWLNFHMPNEVLDWHNHLWDFHGYISIDSKNTKTIFEDYEIINEEGNIYIGIGNKKHKVEVLKNYDTPRITIGFDVTENNDIFNMNSFLPVD
jgi:hypothetical protein